MNAAHQILEYSKYKYPPFQFIKDSSLEATLSELSRSTYSWEELRQRPLPDGVDPAKLEKYLTDEDFQVCCIWI